ncbi:MAG: hypothetical protein QM692_21255 [Thermomicrobiales bacterium]
MATDTQEPTSAASEAASAVLRDAEQARLTAEVAALDAQWELVKTKLVPSPYQPGMDYEPAKRKLALEIEIATRRIRLCEIGLAEAQAKVARVEAEQVEAATAADRESLVARITAKRDELAGLEATLRAVDSQEYAQREAIQDAERAEGRFAGELEWWRGKLSQTRQQLADAERDEAIKRASRAEAVAQQAHLAE